MSRELYQDRRRSVAADHVAQTAEDAALFGLAGAASGGDDAIGESVEGEGLEPDLAGAAEEDEEEAFAAEEFVFDAGNGLDVVIDGRLEGDQAAGIDAEGLAGCESLLDDCAASVKEGETAIGGGEFLQNESLATEEASAELASEGDADINAASSAEE